MNLDHDFIEFASHYFNIEKIFIHPKTKIDSITKDPHAPINFSFEVEKRYRISFNDDEINTLRTVGNYLKLIKEKTAVKEIQKKAA